MNQTNNTKLRSIILFAAVSLGLFAASLVVWPLWISKIAPQIAVYAPSGNDGAGPQNLLIFGCILGLTCLNLVSLMLPDTTAIEVSMAQIAEKIAEPGSLVAGIEREVASNIDRIIGLLKNHSEVSRLYSVSLENAGRNLIELTSPEQLRVAIGYLIAENNKMRKETGNLQSNLKESHLKIENLREDLEVAEETGMRDSLTSLWNRRAFDKMLGLQVETAPVKNSPLCLILADIDHFKKINDNFGHLIGDEILRLVASTISKNVKGRDFVARFGGEEFALILPQTSLENALKLAMQIKHQLEIQKWIISKRNEAVGTVTASFGVAQLQPNESRDALVGRADRKLYDAKNAGRNRVVS
jgi:diguanylate cyclase